MARGSISSHPIARNSGVRRGPHRGFGSRGWKLQLPYPVYAGRSSRPPVQFSVRSSLLLLIACLFVLTAISFPALAQNDDVHITPREAKKAEPSPTDNLDP